MQRSKRARFGGWILLFWAALVLVLLAMMYFKKDSSGATPYDGAVFVQLNEEECSPYV